MRKTVGFILLFIWLLLLSTFLLNAHLFIGSVQASFIQFYYTSYLLLPALLLVTKTSFFQKALVCFAISAWLCLLIIIFISLQQAISKIYGDIYQGSEVIAVYFSLFFMAWSLITAAVFSAVGFTRKFALKKKN